eukprot:10295424-Alexandrium_andersonii.AAC.1
MQSSSSSSPDSEFARADTRVCTERGSAPAAGGPRTSRTAGLPETPPPVGLEPRIHSHTLTSLRIHRKKAQHSLSLGSLGTTSTP